MSEVPLWEFVEFFKEGDTESAKTVYAVLIVRKTYKNPKTVDGFEVAVVYEQGGEFQPWNFNSLEDMFAWLGQILTFNNFRVADPRVITERLWEEMVARDQRSDKRRGVRFP